MSNPFRPIPYREHEPAEKIWIQPRSKTDIPRPGDATYRHPPEVETGDGSVYQAWISTAAGAKGGLWCGTWGSGPGMIWRLSTTEECTVPPPQNILSIKKDIRQVQS